MKRLMKKLGKELRVLRKQSDVPQSKISEHAGYSSPQFVSNVERGIVVPSPRHIVALCQMTGGNHTTIIESMGEIYKRRLTQETRELLKQTSTL